MQPPPYQPQPHPQGGAPDPYGAGYAGGPQPPTTQPPITQPPSNRPPPVKDGRPAVATRAVTSIWRLAIGFFGIYGPLTLMLDSGWGNLYYLSQSAAMLAGVYFAVLGIYAWIPRKRVDEPSPIPRLCVTILTTITGAVFFTLLNGDITEFNSLAIHLIVPGMVLIDWCVFGRNQEDMAAWHPFVGLVLPLIYLGVALWRGNQIGGPLYPFLDSGRSDFFLFLGAVFVGVIIVGYLLLAIGRLHLLARTGSGRPKSDGPYDSEYDARDTRR